MLGRGGCGEVPFNVGSPGDKGNIVEVDYLTVSVLASYGRVREAHSECELELWLCNLSVLKSQRNWRIEGCNRRRTLRALDTRRLLNIVTLDLGNVSRWK